MEYSTRSAREEVEPADDGGKMSKQIGRQRTGLLVFGDVPVMQFELSWEGGLRRGGKTGVHVRRSTPRMSPDGSTSGDFTTEG